MPYYKNLILHWKGFSLKGFTVLPSFGYNFCMENEEVEVKIEDIADRQLEAYNTKDLEGFCNCYHPQIKLLVDGDEKMSGMDNFRGHYARVFQSSPNLNAVLKERMVMNNHVIDIETISGKAGQVGSQKLTAKYSFLDGLISKVEFFIPVED
jgi:uncharacterized protein (TIGR02246 family)